MSTGEPINGKEVPAVQPAQDEAARLAEAQVERLAKKSAENVKAVLGPEPPAAPQVKLVASLSVQVFDNGQANINVPHDDFDATLEMMRMVYVTMIQRARQQGVEAEKAQKKVPFMKRIFNRQRSATKT